MIDEFDSRCAVKERATFRSSEEPALYVAHPSMFRNRPGLFVASVAAPVALALEGDVQTRAVAALLAVIVALSFFHWWLGCLTTTLTVTDRRLVLRKGILGRDLNEVFLKDIRNVRLRQTLFQRLFSVGSLGVSSSGQADIEIRVAGIPHPDRVLELIHRYRA